MELFVDLKGVIDVDAEITRLSKQVEKLQKAIDGKEKKLANANFVERAPAVVVEKERESLAAMKEEIAAAKDALRDFQNGKGHAEEDANES